MNAVLGSIANDAMSSEKAQVVLEKRLKEAVSSKESTEATVKSNQKELEKMFGKKGPQRPRETISELDEKISALERQHETTSMTLGEERELLKKIHKLNIQKRQVQEFESFDKTIKEKKTTVSTLRENLKEQRTGISDLKTQLTTVNTAVELGCEVKDLLGKKVFCPTEKLGNVIGKKGKNVQNLMASTHVNVDIERKRGDIRLIGTLDSLSAATSNLEKTIQQTEMTVTIPALTHAYLTTAKIAAIPDLRERHPDVHFGVQRIGVAASNNKNVGDSPSNPLEICVRGVPKDIEAWKQDLLGLELVQTEFQLTSREAGFVVGKQGANVMDMVERHQATIDIRRPAASKTKEGGNNIDEEPTTKVTITGPMNNVTCVRTEIEGLIAANKDQDERIPIDPSAKSVLLLNNGAGIQALHKKVNDATNKALGGDNNMTVAGSFVAVNFSDNNIALRGKAKSLECAKKVVTAEVARVASMVVKIKVDPAVLPVMIGKGGQGIKKLKEGTKTVSMEFDRIAGEVSVCGLDQVEVDKAVEAVNAIKMDNVVERICLDCAEDSEARSFSSQFRNFLRSAAMKEARQLVFMVADDDLKQIVLRGKPDNLAKAAAIVQEYLTENYTEEMTVTSEGMTALLTGGKKSKIVELASSSGVNLSTERERQAVIVRGEKEKVASALKAVREFLYGGDDGAVETVKLESNEFMGVVIGRGGQQKAELQKKYPKVSIIMHRSEASITLRGPENDVKNCHIDIMKLILTAKISRTVELSEKQLKDIDQSKFTRRLTQLVPVQVNASVEKSSITIRGSSTDVQDALALLKEQTDGVYESRMRFSSVLFRKVLDACKHPAHLELIEKQSRAKVALDEEKEEIILSGKRDFVIEAKKSLVTLLDFIFGQNLSRLEVHGPALVKLSKPESLAEVAAVSGAHVHLDRDLSSILIFSTEPEKVQKATKALKSKLSESENLVYVLQLEPSEDWLVSSIIGKGGASIKKLRKHTTCTIEVDSKARKVVVSAADPEIVAKGKEVLDKVVEKARKECIFVSLPERDLPAFVGRSGAHIREFAEKYGVEVQIMKNISSAVRLTGEEDKVAAALAGAKEWRAAHEAAHQDATAEESKRLRANQIPAVIGAKGSVIRSLEREFGCKIDIDRKTSTVTASGGSSEKRAALFEKIDRIVSEEQEKSDDHSDEAGGKETETATTEQIDDIKPKKKGDRRKKTEPTKKEDATSRTKLQASPSMEEADFPALPTEDGVEKNDSPRSVHISSVWASKSSSDAAQSTRAAEDKSAADKLDAEAVAFVGDVIEAE